MPRDPKRREHCKTCIEQRLKCKPGIQAVSVQTDDKGGDHGDHHHATISLQYDPDLLSLEQINASLRQAGGCFSDAIAHMVLPVEGLISPRHEQNIEKSLNRLPGVTATASYASQSIRLEFDRSQCALPEIVRLLDHMGMRLRAQGDVPQAPRLARLTWPAGLSWLKEPDLLLALLAGVFLLAGFLAHALDGSNDLRIVLLVISYILGGWRPGLEMLHTLRRFKIDIDVLMFAAAFGAASLGHYEEGAMLLFLFSLGGAGERLAMNRARRAIQALARLAPRVATRINEQDEHHLVNVIDLRVGDRVLVKPGELLPADGVIVSGASAVDQAPITGESVPVEKVAGDDVFAGTINGGGALIVAVSKLSTENTIAKVIRLVEQAQTTRSPTELFTDRVERWYVPLVIVATLAIVVIPPLAGFAPRRAHGDIWQGWFYQAMAFLTAASPCALAIGTPAAVLSGIARAARAGALIKGGMHLENLGRVSVVAFDKTGTLTAGRPDITDVVVLTDDLDERQLLGLAASVEAASDHPLARAIVADAGARECAVTPAGDVTQLAGVGITGTVGGRSITVGKRGAVEQDASVSHRIEQLESQGKTVVIVAEARRVLGLIALADQPRANAREMIHDLKKLGIRHTVMLTGDNARTAAAIARQVDVDSFEADLMPEDKLKAVQELGTKFGRIAMVGDGVNDAPALASASVGIAIGGAAGGSDVALETADVALLADDLAKLPHAIGISRFTRRIVVQNLILALGVIAVLAPMAAMGMTPISAAVLFHEGSTVLVVLNALRILGYRTE